MDANGTKFQLLLGKPDWSRMTDERGRKLAMLWELPPDDQEGKSAEWDEACSELMLAPRLFQFVPAAKDKKPELADRRGAGRDRFGNWYWIDSTEREIVVQSPGARSSHFWSEGDGLECQSEVSLGSFEPVETRKPRVLELKLRGLAITDDHYLVVGTLDPAGLWIFDLHAGGPPRQLLWPETIDFAPFDMSPRSGGGVVVLDRDSKRARPARLWVLDRHFQVAGAEQRQLSPRPDSFQPMDGGTTRVNRQQVFSGGVVLKSLSPPEQIDAIAVEALPDGTVLVLDSSGPFSSIRRYKLDRQQGEPISTNAMTALIEKDKRSQFTLRAHDFAFVPAATAEGLSGTVYVVEEQGNQAFAFSLSVEADQLTLRPLDQYLPMRLFAGRGLVRAGAEAYYDLAEVWVPLVEQRRPRFVTESILESPLDPPWFDGAEPDCVWHRLTLDACIPPETRVELWSRAANDAAELPFTQWQPEPRLYKRGDGSEQPFVAKPVAQRSGATTGAGTWELLFQRARGRFLQLRLRLMGNGRSTPKLRSLRAYYPRFSYLEHYLPGVYREDEQSASFLDRFLSNIEGFYTALEDKIAAAQMLFDTRSAPPETLEWLASWLAVVLDPAWDERKRRLFITNAMEFFQYRGTIRGLEMSLRLALDPCADSSIFDPPGLMGEGRGAIRIIENYRSRLTPGVALGDPTSIGGPRQLTTSTCWTPEKGRADLISRYKQFIEESFGVQLPEVVVFPIRTPEFPQASADTNQALSLAWQHFTRQTLGFVPSAVDREHKSWSEFLRNKHGEIGALNAAYGTNFSGFEAVPLPSDEPEGARAADWSTFSQSTVSINRKHWRDFLARRYRRVAALNEAYGTAWAQLESVSLFDELPPDGAALHDWFQFEAVLMSMHRAAHRFTVLLPARSGDVNRLDYEKQRELATRIVNWEKPAHTVFDVRFYWNMFRIGASRLGQDTVLDRGSRAPQLITPMTLGRGYLAESYLAPAHPQDATERQILGRDCLQ